MKDFDIVIRCKNEIEWLPKTHQSIYLQTLQPNNIIFVDDKSDDGSKEFAIKNNFKVIDYDCEHFNYSRSLNLGIESTESEYVLILSAHCILYDETSIEKLIEVMDVFKAAGVYGRQIPTTQSNAIDTRDLLTVFGRERIVYEKYPFFHNAFSLIDKSIWFKFKFDENVNGIEDRLWAQTLCNNGHKIVYEPSSAVYHEHGLNQGSDTERATRVCKSLHSLHENDIFTFPPHLIPDSGSSG